MRFSYSLPILLSVLVIVSACQGGAYRMYMDGHDSHATVDQSKEEKHEHESFTQSSALCSTHQNAGPSDRPSSVSNGALVSTGQLVHTLPQHSAISDTNRIGAVVQGKDEKKEEASQHSPELEAWFTSFVDAVDHAEEWAPIATSIEEGRQRGYLDKSLAWDDDHYTPLHYAAEKGKLRIVRELVEQKISADIITGDSQRTPLHFAAQEGHLEVVKFLIEQCDAQWEKADKEGANTLHYAASGTEGDANVAVVQYLVEIKSANPTTKVSGFNPLYLAIKVNNPELVRYLVTRYPILTSDVCEENVSPLEFARATGKRTLVDIIENAVKNVSYF